MKIFNAAEKVILQYLEKLLAATAAVCTTPSSTANLMFFTITTSILASSIRLYDIFPQTSVQKHFLKNKENAVAGESFFYYDYKYFSNMRSKFEIMCSGRCRSPEGISPEDREGRTATAFGLSKVRQGGQGRYRGAQAPPKRQERSVPQDKNAGGDGQRLTPPTMTFQH